MAFGASIPFGQARAFDLTVASVLIEASIEIKALTITFEPSVTTSFITFKSDSSFLEDSSYLPSFDFALLGFTSLPIKTRHFIGY